MRTPIGPRWLTLVILAFGVLEIPWVIYLVFFQVREGTAAHTHLAALGLVGGGAALAVWAAALLWSSRRLAAVVATMAATWMGANLFFGLTLSAVPVILATIPGLAVAAVAARGVLRDPAHPPARWQPMLLVLVAGVLVAHLVLTLTATGTSVAADHLRLLAQIFHVGLWWAACEKTEVPVLSGESRCRSQRFNRKERHSVGERYLVSHDSC